MFSENDAVSMHGDPQMSSINDRVTSYERLRSRFVVITNMVTWRRSTNALAHRLKKAGRNVQQQYPLNVFDDDGTPIGEYFADLIVEDALIVELKACRTLGAEPIAQILGYLRSAKREHGLLMNFGGHRFPIRNYTMNQESVDL